jgi:hypothetical protein
MAGLDNVKSSGQPIRKMGTLGSCIPDTMPRHVTWGSLTAALGKSWAGAAALCCMRAPVLVLLLFRRG